MGPENEAVTALILALPVSPKEAVAIYEALRRSGHLLEVSEIIRAHFVDGVTSLARAKLSP